MSTVIFVSFFLLTLKFEDVLGDTSIDQAFQRHEVVPDVIKVAPRKAAYAVYQNGRQVILGNQLYPSETVNPPTVTWDASPYQYYTLIMLDADAHPSHYHVDDFSIAIWTQTRDAAKQPWVIEGKNPDAPSRKRPSYRHWLHWLVGNIPGEDVFKGDTVAEYNGPTPPKGTGAHRYVILIFKQAKRINFQEDFSDTAKGRRGSFNLQSFIYKYQLGDIVAGNFFRAFPHEH